ncbi:MAG TPA: CBO0543 family protein [Symbiobacteriaceae bacterium]|jgi:hypothetical protein
MFYLLLAALVWLVSFRLIDWRRLRELLIYGFLGSLVSIVENELGLRFGLWEYRDTAPLNDHRLISLVICLSAAPLFAMAFAQALSTGARPPWLRIAVTTGVAMLPEIIGLYTGNLVYGIRWGLIVSTMAYLPTWLAVWGVHRWYHSHPEIKPWKPPDPPPRGRR